MTPNSRTGSTTKQRNAMANRRHLLRAIATASAACGLLINIIAIANIGRINRRRAPRVLMSWAFLPILGSLAWDTAHLAFGSFSRMHAGLQISGDVLAFLGFVAILVTNGLVAQDLGYHAGSATLLLAYNSFPWVVCAGMHLCLAFSSLLTTLEFNQFPKIRVEWPEARFALLADSDDDVVEEAQSKNKGAADRGDDEESAPLLGSS